MSSYIRIEKQHIKELKKYLTFVNKRSKQIQVALDKSKNVSDISKSINKIKDLQEESSAVLNLLIQTLSYLEKLNRYEDE